MALNTGRKLTGFWRVAADRRQHVEIQRNVGDTRQLVTAETGRLVPRWCRPVFECVLIELRLWLNQDELAVLRNGLLAAHTFVEAAE